MGFMTEVRLRQSEHLTNVDARFFCERPELVAVAFRTFIRHNLRVPFGCMTSPHSIFAFISPLLLHIRQSHAL